MLAIVGAWAAAAQNGQAAWCAEWPGIGPGGREGALATGVIPGMDMSDIAMSGLERSPTGLAIAATPPGGDIATCMTMDRTDA